MKTTEQCVKLFPIPMGAEKILEQLRVHLFNLEADIKRAYETEDKDAKELYLSRWACVSSSIRSMEKLIKISG
jgi:hypothetical protein